MKKQAYQKPTLYDSNGTKVQKGAFDPSTAELHNGTYDGTLEYIANDLEALHDKQEANTAPTPAAGTNNTQVATTAFVVTAISNMMHALYPVGSYIYSDKSANPSTYLPYMRDTTWTQTAQGRVLIGAGTGKDANSTSQTFTAGTTGGEYTHKLTVDELASHEHLVPNADTVDKTSSDMKYYENPQIMISSGHISKAGYGWWNRVASAGNNGYHNNVQPYISVYIFKRTK